LSQFNIPVISDLPVGANMQGCCCIIARALSNLSIISFLFIADHVGLGGLTFVINEPVTVTTSRFATIPNFLEYVMNEP